MTGSVQYNQFQPPPSLKTVLDAGCDLAQHPLGAKLAESARFYVDPDFSDRRFHRELNSRRYRRHTDQRLTRWIEELLVGCGESCWCESVEFHQALLASQVWERDMLWDRSLRQRVVSAVERAGE